MVMNFWPIGSILAAALTLYFLNRLPPAVGWRLAFALGAIVALFTIWARTAIPESPRWLLRRGHDREARGIVEHLEQQSGLSARPSAAETPPAPAPGFVRQIRTLVREHAGRLALGSLLDFSEASGYYGLFAFLPLVVLPAVYVPDRDVPWFFLIGNLGAVAGGLLAAWLLDRAGRKITVTGFYALAAISMLGMGVAARSGRADVVLWSFVVANLCATGSWIAAYPTFSEIFPTTLRSTGIGFSVAVGRIGAAIAPPLLVVLAARVSMMTAFGVLAAFWALGAATMIPWCLWGTEGRSRPLEWLAREHPSADLRE
jgi:MFS family permease